MEKNISVTALYLPAVLAFGHLTWKTRAAVGTKALLVAAGAWVGAYMGHSFLKGRNRFRLITNLAFGLAFGGAFHYCARSLKLTKLSSFETIAWGTAGGCLIGAWAGALRK